MTLIEKNDANMQKCTCPDCPSYNECAKGKAEVLYCAAEIGKSGCPYPMQGCVCGACPVHSEGELRALYYCIHGSAEEIEKK